MSSSKPSKAPLNLGLSLPLLRTRWSQNYNKLLPHQRMLAELCSIIHLLRFLLKTRPRLWKQAEEKYLAHLDSIISCKARMDAKGIQLSSLDGFLDRVHKIRPMVLRYVMGMPQEYLMEIEDDARYKLERWPAFCEFMRKQYGLVIKKDLFISVLPDSPKVLPKMVQQGVVSVSLLARSACAELYRARPMLPDDERLLLAELRHADYEYRSEKIVQRDHGGKWPAEGILISRRCLTDVHLFFKDPSDTFAAVEHIFITDAVGLDGALEP